MAKNKDKEGKTNAMRILERNKIPYEIVSPFSGEISSSFPFPVTREKNVITFDLSSYDGI